MDKSKTMNALVVKAKTHSKTCQKQKFMVYGIHFIPTWELEIEVAQYSHPWSIHLYYTQTLFYGTCTYWKTLKGLKIIIGNLWKLKLINTSCSHGNLLYLYHSSHNQGCFTCFPTCWRSLTRKSLPWMISRLGMQVIELVQKDGMNGLITHLWHYLGYGPTKTK